MKKYIGLVISAVVLVVSIVGVGFSYANAKRGLAEAEQMLLDSEKQLESTVQSEVDKSLRTQIKELTGYDDKRVKTDNMNAEAFFKTLMTWNTYEEYNENRQEAVKRGVAEDSYFLETFFPEVRVVKDADGNEYNTIDNNDQQLNMSLGSLTTRVTKIDGDVYSYFGEMILTTDTSYERSDGSEHDIVGTGKCIVTYDVDADGNITNLDGYVL